jgi:hypothetical protein
VEWKQPAGRALLAMLYAASVCRHEVMPAAVVHELLARPLDVRSVHAETDSAWLLRALSAVCAHAAKQVALPAVSASSSSSFSAMDGRCSIHIETLLRHASFESPSQILNLRLPFVREVGLCFGSGPLAPCLHVACSEKVVLSTHHNVATDGHQRASRVRRGRPPRKQHAKPHVRDPKSCKMFCFLQKEKERQAQLCVVSPTNAFLFAFRFYPFLLFGFLSMFTHAR